jgi:hypothetical protein
MKKKAQLQVPGTLVDFFSYLLFVVIIMLFFLLFQIKGCSENADAQEPILAEAAQSDINTILLSYLRTPVPEDLIERIDALIKSGPLSIEGKTGKEYLIDHPDSWQGRTYFEFIASLYPEVKQSKKGSALQSVTQAMFYDVAQYPSTVIVYYKPKSGSQTLSASIKTSNIHGPSDSLFVPLPDGTIARIILRISYT